MTARSLSEAPAGARAVAANRVENTLGARKVRGPGIPFDPPTCQERTKADLPCPAKRAKSTLFCAGHLRKRGEL